MPELINANASAEREMQQRNANLQFAGQLMLSMVQGQAKVSMKDMEVEVTPEELFSFAIGVAEQMNVYFRRPIDEPSRLVQ